MLTVLEVAHVEPAHRGALVADVGFAVDHEAAAAADDFAAIVHWRETTQRRRRMADMRRVTAIIEREDEGYVALCPEYDVAIIEEARDNLVEALTLFFESADSSEVVRRFQPEVLVIRVDVTVA